MVVFTRVVCTDFEDNRMCMIVDFIAVVRFTHLYRSSCLCLLTDDQEDRELYLLGHNHPEWSFHQEDLDGGGRRLWLKGYRQSLLLTVCSSFSWINVSSFFFYALQFPEILNFFVFPSYGYILVLKGCHNKWWQTKGPKTAEMYSPRVLEVRSIKSRCWKGHALSEPSTRKPSLGYPTFLWFLAF